MPELTEKDVLLVTVGDVIGLYAGDALFWQGRRITAGVLKAVFSFDVKEARYRSLVKGALPSSLAEVEFL